MSSETQIRSLFASPLFQRAYEAGDDPDSPAALPEPALDFLAQLAGELKAESVFEFGSGQSTKAFLRQGCAVTSLEDSDHWMEQTRNQLSAEEKGRHTALVRPLQRRMHGLIPMMDWPVDSTIAEKLGGADIILVDSPYFAPFRESTLWSALTHGRNAVVVLDDTRIPTLSRFCEVIVAQNPGLLHRRVAVGHTFDIFARAREEPLQMRHSIFEIAKGWRRFLLAGRYSGG